MKRKLSVMVLFFLLVPGAWASPSATGAGDKPDDKIACPVEGMSDTHNALQRLASKPQQTRSLMSPVASCGQAAGVHAQIYGHICRYGYYWCFLDSPLPVNTPCCCRAGFCGSTTTF